MTTLRGYRKKPGIIYAIGAVYLILPLLTLFQIARALDFSPSLIIQAVVSSYYLTEVFCAVTAAAAVLAVSRLSFFYLLGLGAYAVGIKASSFLNDPTSALSPIDFFALCFWLAVTLLFLFSTLRIPYLYPQTRWWKRPPRYSLETPSLLAVDHLQFPVLTLNLSGGGAYIRSAPLVQSMVGFPNRLGTRACLELRIHKDASDIFGEDVFKQNVEVAWVSKSKDIYRYGLGLKFVGQSGGDLKKLNAYFKFLRQAGLMREG